MYPSLVSEDDDESPEPDVHGKGAGSSGQKNDKDDMWRPHGIGPVIELLLS